MSIGDSNNSCMNERVAGLALIVQAKLKGVSTNASTVATAERLTE